MTDMSKCIYLRYPEQFIRWLEDDFELRANLGPPPPHKDVPMPRQRIHHRRRVYLFPDDFPERLELLKEESGLTWAEIPRRLGVGPLTVRRW